LIADYSFAPASFFKDFQLVVKLISILISEGAQAAPNHSHQLIVAFEYSKISLHLCKDCRTFCEGVKEQMINIYTNIKQQLTQMFDVNCDDLVNHNGLVGRHNVLVGCNDLVNQIGLVSRIGHNGLVDFIGLGLVGIIGLGLFSLIGQIGLGNLGITSLVGSLALSTCRLIGLIGYAICCLTTIAAAAILSVAVATQAVEETILWPSANTNPNISETTHADCWISSFQNIPSFLQKLHNIL
jgi:hypothetical protein